MAALLLYSRSLEVARIQCVAVSVNKLEISVQGEVCCRQTCMYPYTCIWACAAVCLSFTYVWQGF